MGKKAVTKPQEVVKENTTKPKKTKETKSASIVEPTPAASKSEPVEDSELVKTKQENAKLLQKQMKSMNASVLANVEAKQI